LPIKNLRKFFTTWAVELKIEGRLVDIWTGHTVGSLSQVTARHYYAAGATKELKAVATKLDKSLQTHLQKITKR
jgi:intergrase/recombinase